MDIVHLSSNIQNEIVGHFEDGLQNLRQFYMHSASDYRDVTRNQLTDLAGKAKDAFKLASQKSYTYREKLTVKSQDLLLSRQHSEEEIQKLKGDISACESSISIKRRDLANAKEEKKSLQSEVRSREYQVKKSEKEHESTGKAAIGTQIGVGVVSIGATILSGGTLAPLAAAAMAANTGLTVGVLMKQKKELDEQRTKLRRKEIEVEEQKRHIKDKEKSKADMEKKMYAQQRDLTKAQSDYAKCFEDLKWCTEYLDRATKCLAIIDTILGKAEVLCDKTERCRYLSSLLPILSDMHHSLTSKIPNAPLLGECRLAIQSLEDIAGTFSEQMDVDYNEDLVDDFI